MYDKRCGGRGRGSGSRKGAIRLVRGSMGEARETERSHKKKKRRRGSRWQEGESQDEEAGGRGGGVVVVEGGCRQRKSGCL